MQKITKVMAMFLSAIILACSFTLYGCGDDFFPVVKVSFVTNGETKTLRSYYFNKLDVSINITKEEYYSNVNDNNRSSADAYYLSSKSRISKEYKGKTSFFIPCESKKVYYWKTIERFGSYDLYYSAIKSGQNYVIVYMKVVDNSTIIIKNTKGETTYTVTSFTYTKLEFED